MLYKTNGNTPCCVTLDMFLNLSLSCLLVCKMGMIMAPPYRSFREVPGVYACSVVIVISSSLMTLAVNSTTIDLLLYTKLSDMETNSLQGMEKVLEEHRERGISIDQ